MAVILRQICLVAQELAPVTGALAEDLGLKVCYRDPHVAQFGLENALLSVGSQFLEVVAPVTADAPAHRFLKRRGGDGGYMVICQLTDAAEQAALRARAKAMGIRAVLETTIQGHHFLQLHPGDMGGSFLEADWDERNEPEGHWAPANGLIWQHYRTPAPLVSGITGADLASADPSAVAMTWSRVLNLPIETTHRGLEIGLANATLRFVEDPAGEQPGLCALTMERVDRTQGHQPHPLRIGGIRVDLT
ncbi:MAG: VOC family protein [Alphaproteobacteria bacterium]